MSPPLTAGAGSGGAGSGAAAVAGGAGAGAGVGAWYCVSRMNACVSAAAASRSRYAQSGPCGASSCAEPGGGASARHFAGWTAVCGALCEHLSGSSSTMAVQLASQAGQCRKTRARSLRISGLSGPGPPAGPAAPLLAETIVPVSMVHSSCAHVNRRCAWQRRKEKRRATIGRTFLRLPDDQTATAKRRMHHSMNWAAHGRSQTSAFPLR
mmetsp:Transcript_6929/g.22874  ORF Transcript_6929/g.22874 Transcript_6929/m.22874 type:complete len:210 (-) Transcript_6929:443-1072(-)